MDALRRLAGVALPGLIAGCATITNGGSQVISVNTDPPGAYCVLDRNGERIGVVAQTPGSFVVNRSRKTIVITCDKPGYQSAVASDPAFSTLAIVGNVVWTVGWWIGLIVDESTGADYNYVSTMHIKFPPAPPQAAYPFRAAPLRLGMPSNPEPLAQAGS